MKLKAAVVLLNFANRSALSRIVDNLRRIFPHEWELLNSDFNAIDFFSPARNQYYSTKILEKILHSYNEKFDKILLVTDHDLYVPVLTFVFGEAQLSGTAAVVSTCRLHQEFYGLPTDDHILLDRLEKEIFHELGHTFGLRHCRDWNCVMHSSSNVDEIDIKPKDFCKTCSKKIQSSAEEKIPSRHVGMESFNVLAFI